MLSKLMSGRHVAGTRAVAKAVEGGCAGMVYVAQDADLFIKNKVGTLCSAHNVRLVEVSSMKELGRACGLDVATAAAALLRD